MCVFCVGACFAVCRCVGVGDVVVCVCVVDMVTWFGVVVWFGLVWFVCGLLVCFVLLCVVFRFSVMCV